MRKKMHLIILAGFFLAGILFIPHLINRLVSPYYKGANREGTVWQFDETIGYSSIPNSCQVWEEYFDHSQVSECTDTYGSRLMPNRPLSSKKNIFFIGDSLVWADGIEDTKTFTYFLQEKLAKKNICIYNFAASGYSFLQMYVRITHELAQLFNPDDTLIVGLSADSVLRDVCGSFAGSGHKPRYRFTSNGLQLTGLIDTNRFNRLPILRHIGCWISSKTGERRLTRLYTYLLNDLIAFSEKHHIQLKIVILPFEREITQNKKPAAYRIIEEHTPSQYLLDASDPLRDYLKEGNTISFSPIYRVHYNYPTQKLLASFFEKALE
ncbi:MAG: SGNH/GDSL hydrolase family protein [Candidatus Omnitrophica bacterium]|nr:SGNH/GDSL hydrolase family protein [Candidatus Omnitrophota bacterium]